MIHYYDSLPDSTNEVAVRSDVTPPEFADHLRGQISNAFERKEWKRFKNFNCWVSLKLSDKIYVIIRPVADGGGIPGNMNPMAFIHFPLTRDSEFCTEQAIKYFTKYLN